MRFLIFVEPELRQCNTIPVCIEKRAFTGFKNIIPTIMIGNNEIVFPAMYIINNVIGICLRGPMAMSQDF